MHLLDTKVRLVERTCIVSEICRVTQINIKVTSVISISGVVLGMSAKVGTTVCNNYLSKCTVVSMLEQCGTKFSFIPS